MVVRLELYEQGDRGKMYSGAFVMDDPGDDREWEDRLKEFLFQTRHVYLDYLRKRKENE